MQHKIREMLELQSRFNLETNGVNWKLGKADNGKKLDWLRCIHMEASELIDSTPWKHWKNINDKIDLDNIHIELVDIWHFLMSKILADNSIDSCVGIIDSAINNAIVKPIAINNTDYIIELSETLIHSCLSQRWGKFPIYNINNILLDTFFKLVITVDMTLEDIYKLYIGKNCLNKFRQDNGYKDGSYVKIWNGKEDNVVMKELIDNNDLDFDGLYKKLNEVYKSL